LGDRTVIEVVVERVRSQLDEVIVVLGHMAAEIAPVLATLGVRCVVNERYSAGMTTSVQCGISASREIGSAVGYLICLGDQPGIRPEVIADVIDAAASSGRGIVIPRFRGRRGHPIFVSAAYGEQIAGLGEDEGLNQVTRKHPDDTAEIDVEDGGVLEDMDTLLDYQRELGRIE
jgi:CTP:molybdopterin cytidylyltransferase MocA